MKNRIKLIILIFLTILGICFICFGQETLGMWTMTAVIALAFITIVDLIEDYHSRRWWE